MTAITYNAIALATSTIKRFEGCKLRAYQDANGIWTIGWGDTGKGIVRGLVWTQAQADDALLRRVGIFARQVAELMAISLTDHQAAALIDFAYNCGIDNLERSTLLRELNAGNHADIPHQFSRWTRDQDGTVLPGLVARRQAEAALWTTQDVAP